MVPVSLSVLHLKKINNAYLIKISNARNNIELKLINSQYEQNFS